MKTILRIIVSIMLTYALLSLTNCTGEGRKNKDIAEVRNDFEDDREKVAEDLREFRGDISLKIQRLGDRMETASEDARLELSELNEELLQQRELLDEELEHVESATEENWSEVREGARSAFRDVKREFNQLTERISD
jgi:hypothetical protein